MPSLKSPNGNFNQKIKNFFRIDLKSNHHGSEKEKGLDGSLKGNESKTNVFRNTKFFSTVGRLRSTTTTSEGNPLDDAMSPTANANPYYALQGHPGLRHHNGSVPPSPPDTPTLKISGPAGPAKPQPTNATKEELARKLRRVASAPNAHGLFSKGKGSNERPATAELGKEPLMQHPDSSTLGFVEKHAAAEGGSLNVPDGDGLGALPPPGRNETRRLGARAGASDIKVHPFFRTTQWALIRHMKPPIVPHTSKDIDTVNFRNVKESESVDISGARNLKGVPLDSGMQTPGADIVDPFEEFNSVTLHHEGDDHSYDHQGPASSRR
ncbi:hypothetical protein PG996_003555 [Apiospora saccharicola]|uniref:non-specific serine/threonine protein kinase n=1 Tax=Apiospora saccharicola TaxID=335842 RepID=A0ABR1W1L5_9PEZI